MASLNEEKIAALHALGFTSGSATDRELAWLKDQTGESTGDIGSLWCNLLLGKGYSGSRNEMQIASWQAEGATANDWNSCAIWFWNNGGTYTP